MFDATTLLVWILLGFLILCAIASTVVKSLLTTTLIYMSYGLVMSIIWLFLESPDLAGTEDGWCRSNNHIILCYI